MKNVYQNMLLPVARHRILLCQKQSKQLNDSNANNYYFYLVPGGSINEQIVHRYFNITSTVVETIIIKENHLWNWSSNDMSMEKIPPNDSGSHTTPNPDDSTTTTKSTTKFTVPQKIPKIPSLRESIQEFVVQTNKTLASLEAKYQETIRKPMTQAVHQISDTSTTINEQATYLYKQHLPYEPYAMIGASILVGGLTSLRRGRVAGVGSTVVVGGLSYWFIYGLDGETSPTNQVDWSKMIPQSITDLWKSK